MQGTARHQLVNGANFNVSQELAYLPYPKTTTSANREERYKENQQPEEMVPEDQQPGRDTEDQQPEQMVPEDQEPGGDTEDQQPEEIVPEDQQPGRNTENQQPEPCMEDQQPVNSVEVHCSEFVF